MIDKSRIKISIKGFSLIEMIVAIFILILVMVGMVAIIVSVFQAYQKSQAVKTVSESANFALSSMAKEIRMGKVEDSAYSNGAKHSYLKLTRNRDQALVCYAIYQNFIGFYVFPAGTGTDIFCSDIDVADYDKIMDLEQILGGNAVSIDTGNSYFVSCPSNENGLVTNCGPEKIRGWVRINLKINMEPGKEAEADDILLQTTVSSRDYGWAD